MFTVIPEFEIIKAIVCFIAILVVNYLVIIKFASKMLLHNVPMFRDKFTVYPYSAISPGRYVSIDRLKGVAVAFSGTKILLKYHRALNASKTIATILTREFYFGKFRFILVAFWMIFRVSMIAFESTKIHIFSNSRGNTIKRFATERTRNFQPGSIRFRPMLCCARMTTFRFVGNLRSTVFACVSRFIVPDSFVHDISILPHPIILKYLSMSMEDNYA